MKHNSDCSKVKGSARNEQRMEIEHLVYGLGCMVMLYTSLAKGSLLSVPREKRSAHAQEPLLLHEYSVTECCLIITSSI